MGPPGERAAVLLLWLLLVADAVFVGLHFLRHTTFLDNPLYSLERDRGFAEFFQYTKETWTVFLLLFLALRTRTLGWGAWILVFAYLLGDDAFRIHEELGVRVGRELSLPAVAGMRAQDWGELAVTAVAGTVLLVPLIVGYVRGSPTFRRASRHLLLLLAIIGFFGVFVDMLHVAASAHRVVRFLLGVMEDGGEMVAMSGVVWYVFRLNLRDGEPGFSLRELVRNTWWWRPTSDPSRAARRDRKPVRGMPAGLDVPAGGRDQASGANGSTTVKVAP